MTIPALKKRVKDSVSVTAFRFILTLMLSLGGFGAAQAQNGEMPIVRLDTTEGVITLRLRPDVAPQTVDNFLQYVESGFYDGTVFHRVIPGFMVQGGGFTPDLQRKATRDPVANEASSTFGNVRGSVAMARTNDPDSATSQFFINLVDNEYLNKGVRGAGYTVFGTVIEGMGAVDAIASLPTERKGMMANAPTEPVIIRSATVVAAENAPE